MENYVVTKKASPSVPVKKYEGPPRPFLKRGERWGPLIGKMTKAGDAPPPPPKRDHEENIARPARFFKRPATIASNEDKIVYSAIPIRTHSPSVQFSKSEKDVPVFARKPKIAPRIFTMPCMKASYVKQIAESEKQETEEFLKLEKKIIEQPPKPKNSFAKFIKTLPQMNDLTDESDHDNVENESDQVEEDQRDIPQHEDFEEDDLDDPRNLEQDESNLSEEDDESWKTMLAQKQTLTHVYNPHLFAPIAPVKAQQPPESPPKKRPARRLDLSFEKSDEDDEDEPPVSNVVKTYFNAKDKEKEKKKKTKQKIEKNKLEKQKQKEEEEKTNELDEQLRYYRTENDKLKRMWDELQVEKQTFSGERAEFLRYKELEVEKFERYKESEITKLKRERRIQERQSKANLQAVNRKEQEKEMEQLRNDIKDMRFDFKNKENRWKSERDNLRKITQELQDRIKELEEDIRKRELERIDREFDRVQNNNVDRSSAKRKTSKEVFVATVHSEDEEDNVPVVVTRHDRFKVEDDDATVNSSQNSRGQSDSDDDDNRPTFQPSKKVSNLSLYVQGLHKRYTISDESMLQDDDWMINENDELDTYHTGDRLIARTDLGAGKLEKRFDSGKRVIVYPNGTTKKIYPDGMAIVFFNNGDIKKTEPDNSVIYYYASANTTHSSFPNKLEVFVFANRQMEKHYPEGTKEIIFPDGTVKYIGANGEEEILFPGDGYFPVATNTALYNKL
jgi:centromere protein J